MDAALTPREIQARIRAGQSVEELAASSGMPIAQIEPFAGPVLAERVWLAGQATRGQVRREGHSAHRTLIELVGDRLAGRGLSTADVTWDAWRGSDRLWTLRASYHSGSALHEAVFRYDPTGRFSTAVNEEARWLIGETTTSHGPQPGRRSPAREPDVDAEPTVDLSDTRRVGAIGQVADLLEFQPSGYSPSRLTEVDGIFDLLPGLEQGDDDLLYEMLASINEDSVRIYEGLSETEDTATTARPTRTPKRTPRTTSAKSSKAKAAAAAAAAESTAASASEPPRGPAPSDEAKEPTSRVPRSKKRATVPTWDEIMFGSPQTDR
ncbi:MAG: septation protein SepH [Propionibacteriaceae bacterium]|nr:septation protein SepH [Propionibacteriaceae bacterium]